VTDVHPVEGADGDLARPVGDVWERRDLDAHAPEL
jgi:hypothetical protein